jgi:hypothetical protein
MSDWKEEQEGMGCRGIVIFLYQFERWLIVDVNLFTTLIREPWNRDGSTECHPMGHFLEQRLPTKFTTYRYIREWTRVLAWR